MIRIHHQLIPTYQPISLTDGRCRYTEDQGNTNTRTRHKACDNDHESMWSDASITGQSQTPIVGDIQCPEASVVAAHTARYIPSNHENPDYTGSAYGRAMSWARIQPDPG